MRIISVPVPNTSTAYRIDLDKPSHQDWLAWRYVIGESVEELAGALRVDCSVVDDVIQTVSDRSEPSRPGPRTGKSGDYTYYYLRKDVTDLASYMLERFEKLSARRVDEKGGDAMRNIQNLWGCDFLLKNKGLGERMKGGDKWSVVDAPRHEIAESIWPFDHAFSMVVDGGIRLIRFVSVTPQQVRGRTARIPPNKKILQITYGMFADNGSWDCSEHIAGLFGGEWRCIGNNDSERNKKWLDWMTENLLPAVLTARYNWHVAFGTIPDGPRVLLPTNPNAALSLFKNRDLPAGMTRRQRLKHWVGEHWRKDADLEYVCHHLRGNTSFNWCDLMCELFVSEYDLGMAEFFKAQSREWRSHRAHNRIRVRFKELKGEIHAG